MERIYEFNQGGRTYLFIDFSGLNTKEEVSRFIQSGKPVIKRYPSSSLYTLTNVEGLKVTNEISEVMKEWSAHNKPYVKYGAVYGVDGIKKTMANAISVMSRRTNLAYFATKNEAMAWLSKKD